MGLFKRRELGADHVEQHSLRAVAKEKAAGDGLAEQKVTFLACALGAVASVGGFIFGYVR